MVCVSRYFRQACSQKSLQRADAGGVSQQRDYTGIRDLEKPVLKTRVERGFGSATQRDSLCCASYSLHGLVTRYHFCGASGLNVCGAD